MSRFLANRLLSLTPYTPGEQPQDKRYIKLNTNESPFPPSPGVLLAVQEEAEKLQLYSDPESRLVTGAIADHYGLLPSQVLVGNGSDELLNFAFMAFCDLEHPALFPDITYGFYPVFADLNGVPFIELPLCDDFTVDLNEYSIRDGTVFLANPNAPTGLAVSAKAIERMLVSRPDRMHVIDEAYVDYGAESVLPLVKDYDNLLVIQTFSKSRSMAGARLGFAVGCEDLIRDLNTIKYSTNPYNVNRMTCAAGAAAIREDAYYQENIQLIMENRGWTREKLMQLGFEVPDSRANFLFARSNRMDGEALYLALKERGVLVRHFKKERIRDYVRITVGTKNQMECLIREIEDLLS